MTLVTLVHFIYHATKVPSADISWLLSMALQHEPQQLPKIMFIPVPWSHMHDYVPLTI